ncbi:MAG: nucleotide exchange factor GrpE [Omnitrophica bacterium GWA2_52_8]|nr:MAG: nucleotide exchange factor GrpE [Omnitrophica bacterium GWA2_52_8]
MSLENEMPESGPAPGPSEAADSEITLKKSEYQNLLARLQELEALREKLLRSAADFENAKKRLAREKDEFLKFCQENLIREMLPVLDNFERALAHAGEPGAGQRTWVDGIRMVQKQIEGILKQHGLKRLETKGKKFDLHLHEVVAHAGGDGNDEVIVDEIQAGYLLHDRLLRAAKVRVGSAPAHAGDASKDPKVKNIKPADPSSLDH